MTKTERDAERTARWFKAVNDSWRYLEIHGPGATMDSHETPCKACEQYERIERNLRA